MTFLKQLWRPLMGLGFVLMMLVNYAVLPLLGRAVIVLPDGFWQVYLLAMPVLIAGRSFEKVKGKA